MEVKKIKPNLSDRPPAGGGGEEILDGEKLLINPITLIFMMFFDIIVAITGNLIKFNKALDLS